jgi:hypothetical protein
VHGSLGSDATQHPLLGQTNAGMRDSFSVSLKYAVSPPPLLPCVHSHIRRTRAFNISCVIVAGSFGFVLFVGPYGSAQRTILVHSCVHFRICVPLSTKARVDTQAYYARILTDIGKCPACKIMTYRQVDEGRLTKADVACAAPRTRSVTQPTAVD